MQDRPCRDFFRVGSLSFCFTRFFLGGLVAFCVASGFQVNAANPATRPLSIAAAANLVYALDELNAAFRSSHPEVALSSAVGASGNLVAQIRAGAPYDLFLSADLESSQALIAMGHAQADSLVTFATGRLVLWTMRSDLALEQIDPALRAENVRRIALANTDTAPYGRAAQEVMRSLGVWESLQRKLVVGDNITQTAQFVESGNADLGFVALSLVRSPKLEGRGRWLLVPDQLHAALAHTAVLTNRGAANSAAVEYLSFLRSEPAREILKRFGYATTE
jgi:molybdate transport system substrate-binding protein